MNYYIAMTCGIISGVCLVILALRKKLSLLDSILHNPKRMGELDFIDKLLTLTMLIFWLVSLIFGILLNM
jgi:hypothetical protein